MNSTEESNLAPSVTADDKSSIGAQATEQVENVLTDDSSSTTKNIPTQVTTTKSDSVVPSLTTSTIKLETNINTKSRINGTSNLPSSTKNAIVLPTIGSKVKLPDVSPAINVNFSDKPFLPTGNLLDGADLTGSNM
ncbi:hypothetical protein HK099_006454, partial [Clydaea vesicula]